MSDRVLLVTGSSGIAAAAARLAGERGQSVFIVGRDGEQCRALSASVPGSGVAVCDLLDEARVADAFSACLLRFGRLDAVFQAAGISGRSFGDGPIHECSSEGWDATMDGNAKIAFLVSRAAVRHWLAKGGGGALLNMASVLAFAPQAQHFATHAYAASKGAIIAMSTAMAACYAPNGIRVNAIAPALVRTPMSARSQADNEIQEFIRSKQPLSNGMMEPDDVARTALFLLSDDARHITGQAVVVDAGWTIS